MGQVGSDEMKAVVFRLGHQEFAIDVQHVTSIERVSEIAEMPGIAVHVKGVVSLRGDIVPVWDLKQRMQFFQPSNVAEHLSRIVVLQWKDEKIGMLVDKAETVITFSVSSLGAPPVNTDTTMPRFVAGIVRMGERMIMLVDLPQVIG